MKKTKRIITLTLAMLLSFGTLAACAETNETNGEKINWTGRGVHEATITPRDGEYLIENGATNYKIVIPYEPTEYETMAADLLVEYFNRSTGVEICVIDDSSSSISQGGKYLSVGDTKLMRNSGISVPLDKLG